MQGKGLCLPVSLGAAIYSGVLDAVDRWRSWAGFILLLRVRWFPLVNSGVGKLPMVLTPYRYNSLTFYCVGWLPNVWACDYAPMGTNSYHYTCNQASKWS
jgi:hypothetical protein